VAVSRFIEVRNKETWASVSKIFSQWLGDRADGFGWSEGNPISLENGQTLLCFRIPDSHGAKIDFFEKWAESTDRLYGIASGRHVVFPRMPTVTFLLPEPKKFPVPPWLQQ